MRNTEPVLCPYSHFYLFVVCRNDPEKQMVGSQLKQRTAYVFKGSCSRRLFCRSKTTNTDDFSSGGRVKEYPIIMGLSHRGRLKKKKKKSKRWLFTQPFNGLILPTALLPAVFLFFSHPPIPSFFPSFLFFSGGRGENVDTHFPRVNCLHRHSRRKAGKKRLGD